MVSSTTSRRTSIKEWTSSTSVLPSVLSRTNTSVLPSTRTICQGLAYRSAPCLLCTTVDFKPLPSQWETKNRITIVCQHQVVVVLLPSAMMRPGFACRVYQCQLIRLVSCYQRHWGEGNVTCMCAWLPARCAMSSLGGVHTAKCAKCTARAVCLDRGQCMRRWG